MPLKTVKVPAAMEPLFARAEEVVAAYFAARKDDPSKGMIEIGGERYVMVRAASLSVEFFAFVERLFGHEREHEARDFARNLLFDLAHAIGRADAKNFHEKMALTDPIARLSAGPVHFAHSGWAFVDILPESRPSAGEEYYLLYDHPYAFEADAWVRSGRKADFPVCIMNAGYSSGWCEESFGVVLVASEILCRAKGDDCCRFIMAPPARIAERVERYTRARPEFAGTTHAFEIPDLFARKHTEEELRRNEERFRMAAESSSDLIYEWDIGTRVAWFGSIDKILRYGPGEFPHTLEAWANSVHPEDRERVMTAVDRCLKGEAPFDIEYRIRKKDGTYNDWWARGAVCRDGTGKPIRWIGSVTDITERKRMEEELRNSEARYRAMIEGSADGILIADIETKVFAYANPAMCRMVGYTEEELKTMDVAALHPKDDLQRILAEFEAQARGDKTLASDIPCLRKDGTVVHADVSSMKITFDGRACNLGIFRDITERKRMEQVLRENHATLNLILDTVPQSIFWKDLEGRYLGCNRVFAAAVGLDDPAQIVGKTDFDLPWPREEAEAYRADDRKVLENNRPLLHIIERLQQADGTRLWIDTSKAPLCDTHGRPFALLGVYEDITERKHVEMRVAAVNECLLSLGADHEKNVNLITAAAGNILGATSALYNRVTGDALCTAGSWNAPPDFQPKDLAKGHICRDVAARGLPKCVVIRDLPSTPYAESDPAVRAYGLKTYIGHAVRSNGTSVGSLCAVFTEDVEPQEEDLKTLGALAGALGVEEERHEAVVHLKDKLQEIEKLNTFMTDRERRIVEMKREVNAMLGELRRPAKYGV